MKAKNESNTQKHRAFHRMFGSSSLTLTLVTCWDNMKAKIRAKVLDPDFLNTQIQRLLCHTDDQTAALSYESKLYKCWKMFGLWDLV